MSNTSEKYLWVPGEQAHLLDLVHDAIILRDGHGAIIFWNHGAEKLYGWTSDEALGQHANLLLHTQFPQPLEVIESEALRTGQWPGGTGQGLGRSLGCDCSRHLDARPQRAGWAKQLSSERPNLPVLVLSMYAEDQYAMRVLKAGASGYLTKDSAADELVKAIRKVLSGGRYVSSFLAEKLAFGIGTDSSKLPHETLSDREFQVLRLLAAGRSSQRLPRTCS